MEERVFLLSLIVFADQVPLVMPRFSDEPVVEERARAAEVEAPTPAPAIARKHLHVAAKFVGSVQSDRLTGGPMGALEIGGRLPLWDLRLGAMLDVGLG